MKLCIVSYYGPIESLKLANDALVRQNIEVFDFPLFKYMHDRHEKTNNYIQLFKNFICENDIDIILWWFINIPTDEFAEIKLCKNNLKYAFFNWDEPYNWKDCDIVSKMNHLDYAFVTCQETIEIYKNHNVNAVCLYPGYDASVNYPIETIDLNDYDKYSCDISFCCTNLYDNDILYANQYIKRKKLVDDIYAGQFTHGYTFYIYGPDNLKTLYPKSYKGFARYNELNKIFNYSKINLCTHVLNNYSGYINERVILIGGSGGLLLVDYVKGIEDVFNLDREIIVLDKHFYVNQIKHILDYYDIYVDVRKNMNEKCLKLYNYDKWAETIVKTIIRDGWK